MNLSIHDIAGMFAERQAGPANAQAAAYTRAYQIAANLLVSAAKAGNIMATLEYPLSPPVFIAGVGRHVQASPKGAPEINHRSRVHVVDAAKVFNAKGYPLPTELLGYIPADQRNQFDPMAEAKAVKEQEQRKFREFVGLLTKFVAHSRNNYQKADGTPNIDSIVEAVLTQATDAEGKSLYGWGESTIKGLMSQGLAAFDEVRRFK